MQRGRGSESMLAARVGGGGAGDERLLPGETGADGGTPPRLPTPRPCLLRALLQGVRLQLPAGRCGGPHPAGRRRRRRESGWGLALRREPGARTAAPPARLGRRDAERPGTQRGAGRGRTRGRGAGVAPPAQESPAGEGAPSGRGAVATAPGGRRAGGVPGAVSLCVCSWHGLGGSPRACAPAGAARAGAGGGDGAR